MSCAVQGDELSLTFLSARGRPARRAAARSSWLPALAGLVLVVAAIAAYLVSADRGGPFTRVAFGGEEPGAAVSAAAVAKFTTTDPLQLKPVSAGDAVKINSAIPLAAQPNPSAAPLLAIGGSAQSWTRSLDCLTAAIYYEAGFEPEDGQRAVAQVVLNRVRHPAYPNSVCGVVFEGHERRTGCQFTFTCDGSLARAPPSAVWAKARRIAAAALAGSVYAPVGWSTNYHADYVVPYWAASLVKSAVVGRHIFYRLPASSGMAQAFRVAYAGEESEQLALLALREDEAETAMHEAPEGRIAAIAERPVILNDPGQADAVAKQADAAPVGRRSLARWVIGGEGAATSSAVPVGAVQGSPLAANVP